jgi:hypothetical protein
MAREGLLGLPVVRVVGLPRPIRRHDRHVIIVGLETYLFLGRALPFLLNTEQEDRQQ